MARDNAHTTPHTERAHRCTGAKWPRTPHTRNATHRAITTVNRSQVAQGIAHAPRNALSKLPGEQEARGPGHRTRDKTHRAGTPVNRSQVTQDTAHGTQTRDTTRRAGTQVNRSQVAQDTAHTTQTRDTTRRAGTQVNRSHVAQDTAHTTQSTEPTPRGTRAKWPRTLRAQHRAPSEHTGEQGPSGPGHRTRNTKHQANTPVNRSQVANHATELLHRLTCNNF